MRIERVLKYIGFRWDDDTQELAITTFDDNHEITGNIILKKTYIFSTMIFMRRIIQRMWGRKKR